MNFCALVSSDVALFVHLFWLFYLLLQVNCRHMIETSKSVDEVFQNKYLE